jgi:phage FluMu gp28-like protein
MAKTLQSREALDKLHAQVATATKQARENPLWSMDLDDVRPLVEGHALGTTHSGWANPYPSNDPRSLLLEYQFDNFHDRERFKISLMSRQSGKDFTSEGEAAEDCLARPGTEWMVAAPSERQALDSLEQGKTWAQAFDLIIEDYQEEREGGSETLLKSAEILYSNGSKVRAVPGRPDTVRGRSANLLLTEFDFFDDPGATWRAILPSITNPLKGGEKRVRLITTPNGKGGAADKIWSKNEIGKTKWSKHLVTIYHAVLMGLPVDIEQLREMFDDPDGWAQEFECKFLDGSNVLLPYELIKTCESLSATEAWSLEDSLGGGDTFCGVDFGRQNDPTVCWTVQRVGNLLMTREVLVLRKVTTPEQETLLTGRLQAATRTCFDYTGPGIGLGDYLVNNPKLGQWKPEEHKMGKVELCTFTSQFKRLIFPRLRRAFEQQEVFVPVSREVREDLHAMLQTYNGTEYNYWSPRTKEGHSDRCTALALCLRAASGATGSAEFEGGIRDDQSPWRRDDFEEEFSTGGRIYAG